MPCRRSAPRAKPSGLPPSRDVDAATGHIGGDGDGAGSTGLGDDFGFFLVLLGVEHLVFDAGFVQIFAEALGGLDGDGADEDGLVALVALLNRADDGVPL